MKPIAGRPGTAQPIQPKHLGPPVYRPGSANLVQPKRLAPPVYQPNMPQAAQPKRSAFPSYQANSAATSIPASFASPAFRPVHFGTIQRLPITVNVSDVRFTQSSVSPTFSAIPPGTPKNLENLDSSAATVSKMAKVPAWLNTILVFKLTSDDYGSNTYTLDNRRFYVVQKSGHTQFQANLATFQQVYENLFKFTVADDSKSIKQVQTKADPVLPSEYSVIGEFIRAILAELNVTTVAQLPAWGNIVGSAAFVKKISDQFQFNV
ncbi:MAG: hypothetical protein ABI072_05055 [Edaphobacter sp.]